MPDIPYRDLGTTGEKVSIVGLGGYHLGDVRAEAEAIRIVRAAVDAGINFMDNCWDYHEGESEIRMGKALRDGYRERVFLMTKVDGRTRESAARQIDESLRRLQTGSVDLMQLHEVIRFDDPHRFFAPGGAIEAFLEAKQAGKIRYIGFTGHKDPEIHLHMLAIAQRHGFHFDTAQLPVNVVDAVHSRSFTRRVLPALGEQGVAALAMKSLAGGALLNSGVVTAPECLRFAMSREVATVITGVDSMERLQQAVKAAAEFRPLDFAQESDLLVRTAPAASEDRWELFKTSDRYDSTAKNPAWLGSQTGTA